MFSNHLSDDDLQWMTTSNGIRPLNIKSRISQQPLIRSYSNLKLMLKGLNQSIKRCQIYGTYYNILQRNTTYLRNILVRSYSNLKLTLIGLNQRLQRCQMKMTSNERRPKMEDLKMWKVEYLSNHWPDLTQIWK